MIDDGRYDAFVVEVSDDGDAVTLELTIVAGAHKGDMVVVRSSGVGDDVMSLIGLPVTLVVEAGHPRVER